jgi:hypothetical protein
MAWRQTGRRQTGRRKTGRRQIGRRQPDTYPQDPTNIQVTHVPFQVSKCMKHAQLAFLLFRLSVTITIINIIFLQIKMFLKFGRGNIFPLLKQGETVRLRFLHANAAAESGTQKGPIGNEPSLIPRNSIPKDELGFSLINPEANKSIRKGVLFAKVLQSLFLINILNFSRYVHSLVPHWVSLKYYFHSNLLRTISVQGLIMIPIISSSFSEALADRPGVAAFMAVADCFLVFFALTPFLLHFLTKRFVNEIYFNPEKKVQKQLNIIFKNNFIFL